MQEEPAGNMSEEGAQILQAKAGGSGPVRYWTAFKKAFGTMLQSDASLRCAGVAFYSFLSLFPLLAAAVILFGLLADPGIVDQIMVQAAPFLPEGPEDLIRDRLHALTSKPVGGLGAGLVLTILFALWFGSRGVNAFLYALSRAYNETRERSFLWGLLVSMGLTLGGFAVAAIAIFAIAVIPIITSIVPMPLATEMLGLMLRWPLVALVIFVSTVFLFLVAPRRNRERSRRLVPGALLATLLWMVLSLAFSYYVENFSSYDSTFGSLAAAVVMMLWMYYSSAVFVFGAAFNAELELLAGTGQQQA